MKTIKKFMKSNLCVLIVVSLISTLIMDLSVTVYQTKQQKQNVEIMQSSVISDFYREKHENSIDVLAIGNSDLYSAFNPLQLWHEQGITSYVAAAPKQNMKLAYYMLKASLKVQKPHLIILEVDNLFDEREDGIDVESYEYTAMKYCYRSYEGHKLWEDVKDIDYQNTQFVTERLKYKGFAYSKEVVAYLKNYTYMDKKDKIKDISSFAKNYLPQFINLAKRNHAEILFVCYPSSTSWTNNKHRIVESYANIYDIPFIDFNVNQYDTEFDWRTDTKDAGNHMNYNGAIKFTYFMGKYLKEHYDLNDYRNNEIFKTWDDKYNDFIKEIKES